MAARCGFRSAEALRQGITTADSVCPSLYRATQSGLTCRAAYPGRGNFPSAAAMAPKTPVRKVSPVIVEEDARGDFEGDILGLVNAGSISKSLE